MYTGPPITLTVARIFCAEGSACHAKTASCKVAQSVSPAGSVVERRRLSGVDIDLRIGLDPSQSFSALSLHGLRRGNLDLSGWVGEGDGAISATVTGVSPPGHCVLIRLVIINKL